MNRKENCLSAETLRT